MQIPNLCRTNPMPDRPRHIHIGREADVAVAIMRSRQHCKEAGFDESTCCRIATAVSELARNIIKYAGHGEIILRRVTSPGRRGVEIRAEDQGPGISELDKAMEDRFSTGRSLGLGLPGVRRLMDEFDISSEEGTGTRVTIRKWL